MVNLRAYRNKMGATQKEIAYKSGISRVFYTNIETGKRRPSPEVAQKIADVLGFDWTEFFIKKDEGRKNEQN